MRGGFKCDECTGNHLKNNFQANHFDDSGSSRGRGGGRLGWLHVARVSAVWDTVWVTVTSAVCCVLHVARARDGWTLSVTQSAVCWQRGKRGCQIVLSRQQRSPLLSFFPSPPSSAQRHVRTSCM